MAKIIVPAKLESLSVLNQFITKHIPENYKQILPKIELALEELIVNIYSYAYTEANKNEEQDTTSNMYGKAEVTCYVAQIEEESFFCISICDEGKPFDPFSEVAIPDISLDVEERPIGGLGLFLIKSFVKYYSYRYIDNKNTVELCFDLSS